MVAPITAAPLQWPHPPRPPAQPASSHAFLTSTPQTSPQTELPQLHSRCTAAAPLAAHRIFSIRPRHSLSESSVPPSSSPRWRFVGPHTPTGIDPADPDPQQSRLRAPLPRSGHVTKTASLTLATTMASRPALPPSRSAWLGGGVHSAPRRSSSAATRRQRTGGRRSASPPPAPSSPTARCRSAAKLREEPGRIITALVEWSAARPARSSWRRQVARRRMAAHRRRRFRSLSPALRLPPPPRVRRAATAGEGHIGLLGHSGSGPAAPRHRRERLPA